jgi:polysaccharide biosynthesis protein
MFKIISYVIEIIIYILLFILCEPKVWYVGIALVITGIISLLGNIYIFMKYTPSLAPNRSYVSFEKIKKLFLNGIWNSINSLGNILNSGLDLLMANFMLTGTAMGQIAITKTLSGIAGSFNQLISQPFQPMLLQSYSSGNKDELLKELKFSMKVSGLFSSLIFAGFYSIGRSFYNLWLPGTDVQTLYMLTNLTFFYMIFEGAIYPLYYVYTLTVKNKVPCMITILGGLINIVGMYFLIQYTKLGVYSVVITTTIIMTIISFLTNPIYIAKCLHIKWTYFYPSFFRVIIACCLMTIVFCICARGIIITNWLFFGGVIILLVHIGIVIYLLTCFSKDEITKIVHMIKNSAKA